VPHIPDFLWSFVGSLNFMRLSLKRGAHAVLSRAAYRKFGVSRSFLRDVGYHDSSPLTFSQSETLSAACLAPAYPARSQIVWEVPSSHMQRPFGLSLVSRITSYSVDISIEATVYPSLKGTGPGPYMTRGHLELAYGTTAAWCQPRTSSPGERVLTRGNDPAYRLRALEHV
jgi:hypothetical protein